MHTRPRSALPLMILLSFGCVAESDLDLEIDAMELEPTGDDQPIDDLVLEVDPLEATNPFPGVPGALPHPWPWPGDDEDVEEWVLGETAVTEEWDSGKTTSLSSWKRVFCNADHGPNFLLTDLRAYKEPTSNLDNFIARLEGTCTEYENIDGDFLQTSTTATDEVYSGNHRLPGETIAITDPDEYPIGVFFEAGPYDAYIKSFRILKVSEQVGGFLGSYSSPDWTGWAPLHGSTFWIGPLTQLQCPDQHVMSGLKLKYDTRNGKIRRLRIFCRTLSKQ
ncbi:MAG: hypothetical protein AAF799_21565 [Myxococcota bacterium]